MSVMSEGAAEALIRYALTQLLEARPLAKEVDMRPIGLTVNGQYFVVAVIREQVWEEFEDLLAKTGHTKIPNRLV